MLRAGRSQHRVWSGTFYFSIHITRQVTTAPTGYRIAVGTQREALLFGANEFVADFPDQLQEPCALEKTEPVEGAVLWNPKPARAIAIISR